MKTYNGHRSWNAWNVALWLSNDEPLYREAVRLGRKYPGKPGTAARIMRRELPDRTPDGAAYNQLSVKLAIEDLMEDM